MVVKDAGEALAADYHRRPYTTGLILTGHEHERPSAEKRSELGRHAGVNQPADLGRPLLDPGLPLDGQLTLMEGARCHLRSRHDQLAAGLARLHQPVCLGDLLERKHPCGLGLIDAGLCLGDDLLERDR